jgi:hypothetical protein
MIQHILDIDSRGFALSLSAVRDMANKLLAFHEQCCMLLS